MDQIVLGVYGAAAQFMEKGMESETTPSGMLRADIESNLSFMQANRDYIIALSEIVTNARTPEGKLRFAGTSNDTILEPLIEILNWGHEEGEFKAFSPRSAHVIAYAIRSAIDGVAGRLVSNPELDIAAYSEEFISLFLFAVRKTPANRELNPEGGSPHETHYPPRS